MQAPVIRQDWALFLDADGTLLELASTPDDVAVPSSLLPLLHALNVELSGAVAIVSGRSLAQLRELFPAAPCSLVGLHGLECDEWPPRDTSKIDHGEFLNSAQKISARFPGVLVEDKGAGVALHWRQNPSAERMLQRLALEYVDGLEGYMVQPGKMVIEVRPRGGKGDAIRFFMDRMPWHGRYPVFVGDDLTDECGFVEATGRSGLGILVGENRRSAATHRLADVASVHEWLAMGLAAIQQDASAARRP